MVNQLYQKNRILKADRVSKMGSQNQNFIKMKQL